MALSQSPPNPITQEDSTSSWAWLTGGEPVSSRSVDGGFSREMIYQSKLNPKNGLFLEIYGDQAKEKEGIKYIELTILRENWHFLLLSWKEGKCLTQKFTVLVEIVLIKDAPWSRMLNQFTVLCVCVYFSLVPFHFET